MSDPRKSQGILPLDPYHGRVYSGEPQMTDDEYYAAMAASFVDQAGLGVGDKPLAWLMSQLPGRGSYGDELAIARRLQAQFRDQASDMNNTVRTAGFLGPAGLAGRGAIALSENGLGMALPALGAGIGTFAGQMIPRGWRMNWPVEAPPKKGSKKPEPSGATVRKKVR